MDNHVARLSTGVAGLDTILHGGVIKRTAYLIRGGPGQGKTTLGLHYLSAAPLGESTLFIGFQESEEQLRENATAVGIDVSQINFLSLSPDESFFTEQSGYDIFSAADVEQEPLAESVMEAVHLYKPSRIFIDSLTQLRFISADVFQYRKNVLSLIRFFKERGATVLFSSESSHSLPDDDLQFIADGVICLNTDNMSSTLQVEKFRGSGFHRGRHQMRVGSNGITVFPRPMPPRMKLKQEEAEHWSSGVPDIDGMLHGGIEAGTVTLITGPSGVGKSTLASSFAAQAMKTGRRAAVYLFEEEINAYIRRAKTLQIDLNNVEQNDRIQIEQIEPMRYLADEFTLKVRQQVEQDGIELVVLDSIAGFELTLDGDSIKERLHAFVKSLARLGVSVLLVNEVESVGGELRISEKGISYLSDNVIYLRYMEIDGELTKVMGVLKKRLSPFDSTCYVYQVGPKALTVGKPVNSLKSIRSITPMTASH